MLLSDFKIGLDLDNTIIDYSEVFPFVAKKLNLVDQSWLGSKSNLRKILLKRKNGAFLWEKVQGLVYGEYIERAQLYPGLLRLLWLCKQRGIKVEIVSHKTKFGHHDANKVPLREKAKAFLISKKIYGNEQEHLISEVMFCDTRIDKLNEIIERQFDIFVDDLVEVLNHHLFPEKTKAVLFNPDGRLKKSNMLTVESWFRLERILIPQYTVSEIKKLSYLMGIKNITSCREIHNGINSIVYQVDSEKPPLILKIYPTDGTHNRFQAEVQSLYFLARNGFTNIPNLVESNKSLSLTLQNKIDGYINLTPSVTMVKECIKFINDIQNLKQTKASKHIGIAKDACFSIQKTINKIEERRASYQKINDKNLKKFLKEKFDPLVVFLLETIYSKYSLSEREAQIEPNLRILSPSDFGFHNIIIDKHNKLNFIDFEYFGWDDPVKTLVDFIFHPGFELNLSGQSLWIDSSLSSYARNFEKRLINTWPLYGLLWILIMLNSFNISAISKNKEKYLLYNQLEKAEKLHDWIKENAFCDLRKILVCAR